VNNKVQQFIESIDVPNTRKVFEHVFNKIDVDNIENCNLIQIEQLIVNSQQSSPKSIITTIYVLSSYAKWLKEQDIIDNDDFYRLLQSLDKKLL
jgi:hypothetical protein